eukprot:CAMPEP_0118929274 /NCGR_PEP_ID=MMETSP1169-20130426/6318_1 /TAXON_ID=36882 /ORGANISM="Pyramimonas obovata, Strain CCMP722" /LENGTH=580 /DNA_ID=CAMNT_0006871431 /DNA_START=274 /DNA_END=2016 /DNA_ORIENTATION=-
MLHRKPIVVGGILLLCCSLPVFSNTPEFAEELFQRAEKLVNTDDMPSDEDLAQAYELYKQAADSGHPGSQEAVGLMLLSGVGTEVDVPRGILHLYFASAANSTLAQMALGYRHAFGLGVPKSCQAAVLYYAAPAQAVVRLASRGAPLPGIERVRLSVDHDTNYNPHREKEMVQYYQYSADMGNVEAQTAVGQLLNVGARGMEQDYSQAAHYFLQAAAVGDMDAISHLGHMYANGLGVEADNETALEYFWRGAEKGHAHALYGLGYMYLAGAGVEKNVLKAQQFFTKAADQGSADAHFHLGMLQVTGALGAPDFPKAFHHLSAAGQSAHLLAIYNLALMQLGGLGVPVSCPTALALLKSVAERGLWSQVLERAHAHYLRGAPDRAALEYLRAAEMGLELGQSNAAYLLERAGRGDPARRERALAQALHYHQRAADQGNVNSLLRIGDAYYYGRGTPEDLNKSVAVYRQATTMRSAQAMFNLGVLHEHGRGLPQDLHLAKRYYDMARTTHPDSAVPVTLALLKLSLHHLYINNREAAHASAAWVLRNAEALILVALAGTLGVVLHLRSARTRRRLAEAADEQ